MSSRGKRDLVSSRPQTQQRDSSLQEARIDTSYADGTRVLQSGRDKPARTADAVVASAPGVLELIQILERSLGILTTRAEIVPELRATQVVDLDEWFVAVEGLPSHTPEPVEELPISVSEPPNGPEFIFTAPLTNSLSISQSDASEMQLAFDF